MADVKVKGYSGNEFEYQDVPKIWLSAPESTEEAPVLVPFTYGEAVSKTVEELDFSEGDMSVDIAEGELVKEMTITKPESLKPENIPEGMYIAGVGPGTFVGADTGADASELIDSLITRKIQTYSGSIASVGYCAFMSCTSLTDVSLPECSYVWNSAFQYCTKLSQVYAPKCTIVGSSAFYSCSSLNSITLSDYATIWPYAFAYAFNNQVLKIDGAKVLSSNCFRLCSMSKLELLGAQTIYPSAFAVCAKLKDVYMTIQPAWTSMFTGCSSLQRVIAPNLIRVGSYAFSSCSSLRLFSCRYLSYVSNYAFYSCKSLSVFLLQSFVSLTSSLYSAFSYTPIVSSGLLGYYGSFYVPESLVSTYKAATYWSIYSSRFTSITDDILALFEEEIT